MAAILVIDDQEDVCLAFSSELEDAGYTVDTAQSVEHGIETLRTAQAEGRAYAVAIIDMRFNNYKGSDAEPAFAGKLVVEAALHVPFTQVIVMTAYGDIDSGIGLMEAGAFTYLQKGSMRDLRTQVKRALEYRALLQHSDEVDGMLCALAERLRCVVGEIQESAAALEKVVETRVGTAGLRVAHGRDDMKPHAADYLGDIDLVALSSKVNQSRRDLPNAPFVANLPSTCEDEFIVLRRWSSHSPLAGSALGGGYFMRWKGKGIVLDPGFTFLSSFRRTGARSGVSSHCLDDIDLVIASHDHPDHCEDLGAILALFYAHRRQKTDQPSEPSRAIDLVVSQGVHQRYQMLLENPGLQTILRMHVASPPETIVEMIPGIGLRQLYRMDLRCFRTKHHEILGDETGFGVKFALQDGNGDSAFLLCDTGDTAYDVSLIDECEGADILLIHVGTLEKLPESTNGRGEHLCFAGTVRLLRGLRVKPRLVVLGEWGEEFAVPGYRQRFATFVKKYSGLGDVPILPADLGMRIRLPDCCVWCSDTQSFERPENVKVLDPVGQSLEYVTLGRA